MHRLHAAHSEGVDSVEAVPGRTLEMVPCTFQRLQQGQEAMRGQAVPLPMSPLSWPASAWMTITNYTDIR